MKKVIIASVVIVVAICVWFGFVFIKPIIINKFFPQDTNFLSANLPEANPFKIDTNPFSDSYKNPFDNQ